MFIQTLVLAEDLGLRRELHTSTCVLYCRQRSLDYQGLPKVDVQKFPGHSTTFSYSIASRRLKRPIAVRYFLRSSIPSFPPWSEKRQPVPFGCSFRLTYFTCRKYYDLLEVAPDASESELKKAYRKKLAFLSTVSLLVLILPQGVTSTPGQRR